ncbi:MAG: uL15m family ribosomal protein [Candidatus Micrarchaeia archaeon]
MVIRHEKRNRKYHGTRSWGAGNIKNNRGAGDRGGVGKGGKKHKFTYIVKFEKETIHKKGFVPWNREKLLWINLDKISKLASKIGGEKPTVELKGYKVLSDGNLEKPVIVKAEAFSKKAQEKIKSAGGEALSFTTKE